MSDDRPAIDRGLLRRLDWAASDAAPETAPPAGPDTPPMASAGVDISAVLDAVQVTASSMSAMAERIQELEAHTEAFAASNQEIEAQNRQLTIALGEVVQSRDALAASLEAENERLTRLEGAAARHIARATSLERDLSVAHEDLSKIVDAVGGHLGAAPVMTAPAGDDESARSS